MEAESVLGEIEGGDYNQGRERADVVQRRSLKEEPRIEGVRRRGRRRSHQLALHASGAIWRRRRERKYGVRDKKTQPWLDIFWIYAAEE